MPTLMPAVEDSSLPFVTVAGPQGISVATSCERRREFEKIVSNALPRLQRIAMRSLRHPEDAEDAVQDAILSAFRHIGQFDGRAQMSTWLISIVINAVRMQLRRRGRRQMLSLDEAPKDGQWAISELLVDSGPTPEQTLEQGEQRELIRKLIAGLPASQKAALRLHQRDDFSIKKAAVTLGVPQGTVKARLTRGRAELAERFQNATRKTKTRVFSLDLKAGRQAFSSEYRPERTQAVANLPVAAFSQQQGGCAGYGA